MLGMLMVMMLRVVVLWMVVVRLALVVLARMLVLGWLMLMRIIGHGHWGLISQRELFAVGGDIDSGVEHFLVARKAKSARSQAGGGPGELRWRMQTLDSVSRNSACERWVSRRTERDSGLSVRMTGLVGAA